MKWKPLGAILSLFALGLFTFLTWKIAGWWCVVFGPLITLAALRPTHHGGKWFWEL